LERNGFLKKGEKGNTRNIALTAKARTMLSARVT